MDWIDRAGRRVKLRDLHILMAVAEAGSMSKASERLAVSHPVVSKTISDLEHNLGVRLFDRASHGVEPTAYGQALLQCGAAVFDAMRQGIKQIEFLDDPTSGELRIGCPDIITAGLLPAIIERFSRDYPKVRFHVIHANTAIMQFHELRNRNVELLFGRTPLPVGDDDLAVETLSMNPSWQWRAHRVSGPVAEASNCATFCRSPGFCLLTTAPLVLSSWRSFAQPNCNLRFPAWRPCQFSSPLI